MSYTPPPPAGPQKTEDRLALLGEELRDSIVAVFSNPSYPDEQAARIATGWGFEITRRGVEGWRRRNPTLMIEAPE